jgi:predicted TIM-barrel fold metal-dependent hydrolase
VIGRAKPTQKSRIQILRPISIPLHKNVQNHHFQRKWSFQTRQQAGVNQSGKEENMTNTATLENPIASGIGPAGDREPQNADGNDFLPAGLEIISADDHFEITEDIFYERVPAHLKELAPRVTFDEIWTVTPPAPKGTKATNLFGDIIPWIKRSINQRGWELEERAAHLRAEGISREIAYPQSIAPFAYSPNMELREAVFDVYNEYIAEISKNVDYFNGVGVCPNWWEPEKAEGVVRKMVDQGLKTFMLPFGPRLGNGQPVSFADPMFERLFAAAAEAEIPVSLHIGESAKLEGRGGPASVVLHMFAPFRLSIGQMIFGGVFDRHPKLKVVFAEGGISWVPVFLQDAELVFDSFGNMLDPLKHRPSHYWHNNCYATFTNDNLCIQNMLKFVGADRIMWATDYPHSEGSFGYSRSLMKQIVESTTEAEARLILGDTAKKLYKF